VTLILHLYLIVLIYKTIYKMLKHSIKDYDRLIWRRINTDQWRILFRKFFGNYSNYFRIIVKALLWHNMNRTDRNFNRFSLFRPEFCPIFFISVDFVYFGRIFISTESSVEFFKHYFS